ncbi:MAG: nicotinate-nucleotide--dimethylbenzimidazole phosphoribosyltransferase [Polyangiaceae bacterium]
MTALRGAHCRVHRQDCSHRYLQGLGSQRRAACEEDHVIDEALARIQGRSDPFEIARALGGLEILAMAGFVIGSVSARVPVVIDGVIASAASLVANALRPGVERFASRPTARRNLASSRRLRTSSSSRCSSSRCGSAKAPDSCNCI